MRRLPSRLIWIPWLAAAACISPEGSDPSAILGDTNNNGGLYPVGKDGIPGLTDPSTGGGLPGTGGGDPGTAGDPGSGDPGTGGLPGTGGGDPGTGGGDPGTGGGTPGGDPNQPLPILASTSGMRRLTAAEYDATMRDLLQDTDSESALFLPEDVRSPFDNDFNSQTTSNALIDGAEHLAGLAVERLMEETPRRDLVVGCSPSSATDEVCMKSFVEQFGRRALRRPLTTEEVTEMLHGGDGFSGVMGLAMAANDFYAGVDAAIRTFLQDPEFIYRVEIGTPVSGEPDVLALNDFEVASRLSYLVLGTTPDDQLLDLAQAGTLNSKQELERQVNRLLTDSRAVDRIVRFHSMWLGFEFLPHAPDLTEAMQQETAALIKRVVFDENRPWQDLFRLTETYVNDALAAHYGIPAPGSNDPVWVSYPDNKRQGILSHGSFLSIGAKFGDTSPVQRGLFIRTRLFCQEIPPAPPDVDVDEPPESAATCKEDRYAQHRTGGCAGCHSLLDPVGFGLEAYDGEGRFRTHETDNPDTTEDEGACAISGAGELAGVGPFNGPAELADLALSSGVLTRCVAMQLHRFSAGHYALDTTDEAYVDRLTAQMGTGDFQFKTLLNTLVSSQEFGLRRIQ